MKVAVIGAGPSGLCAIKECLQQGLTVTCFDQDSDIGGLWKLTSSESHSSIYESVIVNTSKQMMGYSDFPIPQDWPTFLPRNKVYEYLELYAKHHGLRNYIKFNRRVIGLNPILDDYSGEHTGKWQISVERVKRKKNTHELYNEPTPPPTPTTDEARMDPNKRVKIYIFDAVMIASGHHWKPNLPEYAGIEQFQGKLLHSHSYRVPYPFKDKRVLIVGVGNSGMDIATELSNHASKVILSTRSGTWILPKYSLFGLPTDQLISRASSALPRSVINFGLECLSKLYTGDMTKYGLQPSHHVLEAAPTLNSEILNRIGSGKITVKPNVSRFCDMNTVQFEDETEQVVDVVVYCTGYSIQNHFIESCKILGQEKESHRMKLYKHIFPIEYKNIAWIGLVQPLGSILPVSEMQSRWAVGVFKGQYTLPLPKVMRDEIDQDWIKHCKLYIPRERHTIQVDYVSYMDCIAKEIGCLPDFMSYWREDWMLALQLTFGPTVPAQYRLVGPGKWENAKRVIADACYGCDFSSILKS